MDSKQLINRIATKLGMEGFKFEETVSEPIVEVKLMEATLEDGTIIYTSDELALGVQVYTDAEMTILLGDGPYVTEDGTKFEIIDEVVGVFEAPEDTEEVPEDVEVPVVEEEDTIVLKSVEIVDGTMLYYAPELELAVDTALYNDELMTEPATEEEYSTVDGMILSVKAGIITEILSVIEEYTRMKQVIADNKLDIEDLKVEFTALTDINTSLSEQLQAIKDEKDAAPAVESLKFAKTETAVENTVKDNEEIAQNRKNMGKVFASIL